MSTTIRVHDATRDRLAALARTTGRPMTDLVDEALNALERQVFFDALNARYKELRAQPAEWAAIEAEREGENNSLTDSSQ